MAVANDIVLFGGLLLDRYFHIDRWPVRGQDGFFDREESFVGGCAINMAVTIHNLGGSAHVVSCLGNDLVSIEIRSYLTDHCLSQALIHSTEGTTGSCLVFSEPEGERTFLTHKGVEESFPSALDEKIQAIAPVCAGVTGYYLLGEDAPQILDCLEGLHTSGTRILFDPSPLVGDICPDLLSRILTICDVLTPNETELNVLGGTQAIPGFLQSGKVLILKRGAGGGTVYSPESCFDYSAFPCESIDTTGAGDSFSGALLYAMAQEIPPLKGIELAAQCAAKTVKIRGPHGFWKLEESNNA